MNKHDTTGRIAECFHDVVQADDDMDTASNRLSHFLGVPKEDVLKVLKRIWKDD
jgi:hypothetical protein